MKNHGIELVIFDLGRVLVDFDFEKIIAGLKSYSTLSASEIRRYFETTPLWDRFEKGLLAPALFFSALEKDLDLKGLSYPQFELLRNDIFTEKHETVEVLSLLRGRYRLAMLSNVNIMHWEFIAGRHAFMSWFDYPVASYAVGYRKPEAEVFREVLRRAQTAPEKAIFIDDLEAHVQAARLIGIRAHQFLNAPQLKVDLADIL
jgi:putative hydrolase of the HAD superfamily